MPRIFNSLRNAVLVDTIEVVAISVSPLTARRGRSGDYGLYRLNEDQIAERGARMARRDDREYREYLREE